MPTVPQAERPGLADFRALAPALPPSERLNGADVADVLSAVIAVITHGRGIIDAAHEGSNGVYHFLHGVAVDKAEADGVEAPQKGAQLLEPVAPVTPAAPGQAPIDYDQLAAAIVRAQQTQRDADAASAARERDDVKVSDAPDATAPAPADETVTSEAPAHQGDASKEPTAAEVAAAQSQETIVGDDGIL